MRNPARESKERAQKGALGDGMDLECKVFFFFFIWFGFLFFSVFIPFIFRPFENFHLVGGRKERKGNTWYDMEWDWVVGGIGIYFGAFGGTEHRIARHGWLNVRARSFPRGLASSRHSRASKHH